MGFDRRQDPGARSATQPGALARGAGKQTLVAAEPGGTDRAAQTPGKQTRVHAELEAHAPGSAPMQRMAVARGGAGTAGPPPAGGGGTPLPPDLRARMEAALGASFAA